MPTEGGPRRETRSRAATQGGTQRGDAILDAVAEILEEEGVSRFSTREVAARARASKETIYAKFQSRSGLLEAFILRQADATNERLSAALDQSDRRPIRLALVDAVTALLTLLTGRRSLAINRAAIGAMPAAPELAQLLLTHGRNSTGRLFEDLLRRAHRSGELDCPDPADAFTVLFGLAVRDAQIKALLGAGGSWTEPEIARRASQAVDQFYRLYAAR